jgi:hypothetical protein
MKNSSVPFTLSSLEQFIKNIIKATGNNKGTDLNDGNIASEMKRIKPKILLLMIAWNRPLIHMNTTQNINASFS